MQFKKGDATYPIGQGNKIIAHICNDICIWGSWFRFIDIETLGNSPEIFS